MPCARCNVWVEGWRHYHGGPGRQIFFCTQCLRGGWGRKQPGDADAELLTSLLNSLAEHPGADIAIIRGHLHSFDLLAALDANAKLLEAGTYNLAVCHTILLLLEVNEVRVGVRRGVETQFLQFEGRTIERYRQEFPEFNQALLNFWGAWEGTRPSTESYAS